MGSAAAFTAAQWEELGRQALIYKHLVAGVPVPPDLLLPLRASSAAGPLYYHPTLGYLSYYGKKLDPEPGRCRRTDGKKWRCSKEAHPDSKYCERHMHRSRNRSRKPVETKTVPHSQSSSSAATSRPPAGAIGSGSGSGSFGSVSLQHSFAGGSYPQGSCSSAPSSSQWQLDPGSYGLASKEYRCLHGVKAELDGHSFFSEASGGGKGVGMDSSVDSSWRLMPSEVSTFTLSKERTNSLLQSNYPQLQSLQDLGQLGLSTSSKEQQEQHSFLGDEFGLSEPAKHESQPLRPFFVEWPRTRDSWDLDNERSNRSAFSTTQLSMSTTPIVSTDFSTTTTTTDSRPTNGVPLY